jgi:hypothetical protein
MSEQVTCPQCNGRKGSTAFLDGYDPKTGRSKGWTEWTVCSLCKGVGTLPAEEAATVIARREKGEALRQDRIARGLSQREEAKRLGITPMELNAREHGREV